MTGTDNRVSKGAEFYLNREEKERRNTHTGGVSERLSPQGSLSSSFYKDFISWFKGS
jgi:hypothetical protein